jgi:hypothetical protein
VIEGRWSKGELSTSALAPIKTQTNPRIPPATSNTAKGKANGGRAAGATDIEKRKDGAASGQHVTNLQEQHAACDLPVATLEVQPTDVDPEIPKW